MDSKRTIGDLQLAHMKKMEKWRSEKAAARPPVVTPTAAAKTLSTMTPAEVMTLQYNVIKYLQACRKPATADDIMANTGVNLASEKNRPVAQSLASNERIAFDAVAGTYAYRAGYDVHDAASLADVVGRFEDGVNAGELRDSHPTGIDVDVQRAVQDGRILSIRGTRDAMLPMLFPMPRGCVALGSGPGCAAISDLKVAWAAVKLPDDFEIEKALKSVGIDALPASTAVPKAAPAPDEADGSKGKKRKKRKKIQD